MDYRIKFYMEGRQKRWSYVFYYTGGSSAESVLEDIIGPRGAEKQDPFVTALRSLHETNTVLAKVSASNLNGLRKDSVPRTPRDLYGLPNTETLAGGGNPPPDTVGNSILWRLFGADGTHRLLTISGVADHYIEYRDDGSPLFKSPILGVFNAFTEQCNTVNLAIRASAEPAGGTLTERFSVLQLIGETGTSNKRTRVIFADDANLLPVNTIVRFLGIRGNNPVTLPIKNEHKVVASGIQADGTFAGEPFVVLDTQYLGADSGYIPTGLTITGRDPQFTIIQPIGDFVGFGTRDRGNSSSSTGREAGLSFRRQVG